MKKFLPHIIAVLSFLVITWLYFQPLFSGKELKQGDINNWKGMSHEIVTYKEKTGEQTFWTNSMFGGMPGYQISAVYGANLVQYIDKVILFLPSPANLFFLYLIGFYFLLIVLGIDKRLAIIGAFAFAFSSYLIIFIEAGHNSKAHAIGYMAPVIAGLLLAYRGRMWLGAAITGLALALELYANHLQITYYLLILVLLLGVMELFNAYREKRLPLFFKTTALLAGMAVLAVAANITNLWATQEYGRYSTRGPSDLTVHEDIKTSGLDKDYITDWSYGVGESWTFLIPDFKGGASEPIAKNNREALRNVDDQFRQNVGGFGAYFGDQPFTSGPVYLGAIICMLFLIGAFIVRGPEKWWLVSATILSVMLSWGKNFMFLTNLFLDYVPGYDKFRAVTTILVLAEFTVPLLAVMAVDQMLKDTGIYKNSGKRINLIMGIVLGITVLIMIAPGQFTSFYTPGEYDQVTASVKGQNVSQDLIDNFFNNVSAARKHILERDAQRTFFLLLVTSVLVWSFLKFRYNRNIFIYSLLALVLIDLAFVGKRYLGDDDFIRKSANAVPFPESAADRMILQDTAKDYRVLNLAANVFNDAGTSYYHKSIGGYHGAKLKRYKELIDFRLTPELAALKVAIQKQDSNIFDVIRSQPVLNMLNTKYIIINPDGAPLVNTGALGNAWFVTGVEWVPNADSEMTALNTFQPAVTAVVEESFKSVLTGFSTTPDSTAGIVLTDYKPDMLTYSSNSTEARLAVFSEIYYDKGWKVYVDGKEAPYARADYVLRCMVIPGGKHTIEWKFEPEVVKKGEKIAFAGSLLLLLVCAGAGYQAWKRRENPPSV